MKVVFLQDVAGVAQGGDVKEVKNGFARNYLIPKQFAVPATHNALQRVKQYAEQAEKTRLRLLQDMRELSETLNGKRIDVEMRAGASGQLYGSVTNTIIADKLSEMADREIDRRGIEVEEPIRQLGSFDVSVRLHPEVQAQIEVLVYPTGTTADAWLQSLEEAEEAADGEGEAESDDTADPENSTDSEEENPSDAS
ncbi:MAG: 50S ribosomal protein L9 [Chloroflexi bacterium]|nr:50S ribosomal protein L9 [Chloroflexota bacterium]